MKRKKKIKNKKSHWPKINKTILTSHPMNSLRCILQTHTFSPALPFCPEAAEIQRGALGLYNPPPLLLLVC